MSKLTAENPPKNDGEVRQMILETIMGIRDGSLDVSQGTAMAGLFKELNNSLNASINAAKLSIMMEDRGRAFVKNVRIGQQEVQGTEPE